MPPRMRMSDCTYILAALGDVGLDIVNVQAGVEHGIDCGILGSQTRRHCIGVRVGEGHARAALGVRVLARLQCQGRESLEGQRSRPRSEARDELCGQREDGVEVQRSVHGFREGGLAQGSAHVCGVASLDGQDGAGRGQVRLVGDGAGGAQVGRDADSLEDGGERHKGLDIGAGEGVCCFLDCLCAEGGGEEGHMVLDR